MANLINIMATALRLTQNEIADSLSCRKEQIGLVLTLKLLVVMTNGHV